MATRDLTAQAALRKVETLGNVKEKLNNNDNTIKAKLAEIRAEVKGTDLPAFDSELDNLVNG
jgi:hypothetical protein